MSLFPQGERVEKAIRWISGQVRQDPSRSAMALAHEAILQFDLTPREGGELIEFYRSAREIDGASDT